MYFVKKKLCCLLIALVLAVCTGCDYGRALPDFDAVPDSLPGELPGENAEASCAPSSGVSLHCGIRADGSFDEHTLFVGDSLTFSLVAHYLKPQALAGDCRYAAKAGAAITAFFDPYIRMEYDESHNCLYSDEFYSLNMAQAAGAMGEDLHAFYFMMGTNFTEDASAQTYIEICDYILESCPNATVFLQTVPYSPIVYYETVNQRIRDAYTYYQKQGEPRVLLIDICQALGRDYLIGDQVHLSEEGREVWYQALLNYSIDHHIPQ